MGDDDLTSLISQELGVPAAQVQQEVSPKGDIIYGFRCEPQDTVDVWRRARLLHEAVHLWPFISHTAPTKWEWLPADSTVSLPAGRDTGRSVLDQLVDVQADDLFTGYESCGRDLGELARQVAADAQEVAPRPLMALRNHFAYAPRWICLARVENSFALPEILDAPDAVNHVPWPDGEALSYRDHASVLREWDARYGVEVSYLGTGALLLSIDSPPVDPIEVARVAIEQYAYCPDLEQVLGGIEQVAARQVSSPQWFFWWD